MTQTDYAKKKLMKRIKKILYVTLAVELKFDQLIVRQLNRKIFVKKDLKTIKRRKIIISTTYFNINIYSEERSLKDFRF